MKIELIRVDNAVQFLAQSKGNQVYIDGPQSLGGSDNGFRPTELLLCAIGSCACFDFVSMLYKQGTELEDIIVEVEGERRQEGSATPFTNILIRFKIQGNINLPKDLVDQFAKKSVYELCSVKATLRKETTINYVIQYY